MFLFVKICDTKALVSYELPNAMKTQHEAVHEGYDVDPAGPGRPMGARGKLPRMEMIPLLTDLEEELITTLGLIRKVLVAGPTPDTQQGVVRAIDQLLGATRG